MCLLFFLVRLYGALPNMKLAVYLSGNFLVTADGIGFSISSYMVWSAYDSTFLVVLQFSTEFGSNVSKLAVAG